MLAVFVLRAKWSVKLAPVDILILACKSYIHNVDEIDPRIRSSWRSTHPFSLTLRNQDNFIAVVPRDQDWWL